MKLLLDENLSHRLVQSLASQFPGTFHVRDLGLKRSPDTSVWQYAKNHDYIIVSKDSDYHHLSTLYGAPPKVIGLLVGNCSTAVIRDLILRNEEKIVKFVEDHEASFLPLVLGH